MDLKAKLEMLKSNNQPAAMPVPQNLGPDVEILLKGAEVRNPRGSCFLVEQRIPLDYSQGGHSLKGARRVHLPVLSRVCSDIDSRSAITDFAFMDTETTGLAGGTGTVAFLVGVGCFQEDGFVLRQYFLRDYHEEPAMLEELNRLLASFTGLVTFNGKAFDWNLLQTRFTFNRMRSVLREPAHIDLLYPCRRIWKDRLEDCRLQTLEHYLFGMEREDDIPGSMIPGVYFKYLEDRNAADIVRVMHHNELDILSLALMVARLCSMLENPLAEREHERMGLGRIFEANGEYEEVIRCYRTCLKASSTHVRQTSSLRLAGTCKRLGQYTEAVELWEGMTAGRDCSAGIKPYIELAKHYEHREKDAVKALAVAEKAMGIVFGLGHAGSAYRADLEKRIERLKRKAGKSKHA